MNNLGLVLIDEQLFDQAIPVLARATELRTDVAVFFNNLGMALEKTAHFRDAEVAYAKALDLDESYEKAFENLNRIAAVAEDPEVEPIDLTLEATAFVAEIQTWSDEPVAREEPVTDDEQATAEVIQIVSVAADSTGIRN
jgi:tetratricopeptide (TPR) repeat protein